jgi:DNA-binding IclR family transcriptional regulator
MALSHFLRYSSRVVDRLGDPDGSVNAVTSGVGVLDKAVHVLRALAGGPLSLNDLQRSTGLARATAHRLAAALEQHGLVRRDPAGRFVLGLDLVALGRAASESYPLTEIARPVMERLRDETSESVQLYVRDGDQRRCVLSLQSPHGLRWIVPEGIALPLGVGSAGRVLSEVGPGSRRGAGNGRRPAWVESVEEREKGVASVSSAIRGRSGEVIGAVSVSGPLERLTRQPGRRFGAATARAAADVAAAVAAAG